MLNFGQDRIGVLAAPTFLTPTLKAVISDGTDIYRVSDDFPNGVSAKGVTSLCPVTFTVKLIGYSLEAFCLPCTVQIFFAQ